MKSRPWCCLLGSPNARTRTVIPTFVIGLREGVEASLIVAIIAAFLKARTGSAHKGPLLLGVGVASALCLAVGIILRLAENSLPQKQQEGLETVVGLIALAMVIWMMLWMRRHARDIKKTLETSAGQALADGSTRALILMAFLAVLREGLETAVFLVAATQSSTNATQATLGAVLGIVVAVVVGVLLYRGSVKINMAKFFRVTGVVLALVAAGLASLAMHTAHEAGWLNIWQSQAADLTWLVKPGSIQSALLTGMFGLQPRPTVGEAAVWLITAGVLLSIILWPAARVKPVGTRSSMRETASV
jgi:high-affinity iron transporter